MNDMSPIGIAAKAMADKAKPELPTFERKWWYSRKKLDARPLIWGLKHHPKEFSYLAETHRNWPTITHTDSNVDKHIFVKIGTFGRWKLREAECDCSQIFKTFQIGHSFLINRALREFNRANEPDYQKTAKHFASHFVHH